MSKVYQLGIFQQLDVVYPIEASSEKEAREILLKMIEDGEIEVLDNSDVESYIERVEALEEID